MGSCLVHQSSTVEDAPEEQEGQHPSKGYPEAPDGSSDTAGPGLQTCRAVYIRRLK